MKYRLYLDGLSWMVDGKVINYKIVNSRNSREAALTYGKDVTITNLHGKVLSKAKLSPSGRAYNVSFQRGEVIEE